MDYVNVIKDFNNGTIDPKKVQLVMDNDGGYWDCIDEELEDEQRETIVQNLVDKYGDPHGYRDVVKILNAAGVNADWC